MRAYLYSTPRSPEDWLIWANHHRDSHTRIRQAIQTQENLLLNDYPIDPITTKTLNSFLQYNAQMHADMNGATRQQGSDLLSVNLNDEQQRLAWIALHAKEHENVEIVLGI